MTSLSLVPVIAASLLAAPPLPAADRCTRVQPGIRFPQPAWLADLVVDDAVRLDLDGDGVKEPLVLRKTTYPAAFEVTRVLPDGRGGLRGEPVARFIGPDPWWDFYPDGQLDAGDLDGDGLVDLIFMWRGFITPDLLHVRRGLPAGGWAAVEETVIGSGNHLAGVGDFDGDGRSEILTWWSFWWFGTRWNRWVQAAGGGLTQAEPAPFTTPPDGWVHVADLDLDGFDDIVFASSAWGTGPFRTAYGDAARPLDYVRERGLHPRTGYLESIAIVPGPSGENDIVVFQRFPVASPAPTLTTFHSVEDRELVETRFQETDPRVHAPHDAFDVDRDGDVDLVRGTLGYDAPLQFLLAGPDGTYTLSYEDPRTEHLVATEHVDDDGLLDAIVIRDGALAVQRGTADGEFRGGEIVRTSPPNPEQARFLPGDLDEDGRLDLVCWEAEVPGPDFETRLGDGGGGFTTSSVRPAPAGYVRPFLADLDGDGHRDLVALSTTGSPTGVAVAYGLGNGTLEPWTYGPTGGTPVDLLQADLDGDGPREALVASRTSGAYRTEVTAHTVAGRTLSPTGTFEARTAHRDLALAAGDVDGAPGAEVVYSVQDPDDPWNKRRVAVRAWNAATGFDEPRDPIGTAFLESVYAIDVADLDRDGRSDLLVRSDPWTWLEPTESVYRNRGDGSFSLLWTGHEPSRGRRSRLTDLDGDGHLDLVGDGSPFFVRRGDGTGRFGPAEGPWIGIAVGGEIGDVRGRGVLEPFGFERRARPYREPPLDFSVLVPQTGAPLEADAAPPQVRFVLEPEGDDVWTVASSADDDCRTARIVARRVRILRVPPGAPVSYVPAEFVEIDVLEDPRTGSRAAILAGPDMAAMRALWARAQEEGGIGIPQNHRLRLIDDREWGPAPTLPAGVPIGSAMRVVQVVRISDGVPVGVEVHHPVERLALHAVAEDELGRRGDATASLEPR